MNLGLGDLSTIAAMLVIVGGLQWRAMKATIKAEVQASEVRLGARIDVLSERIAGLDRRVQLLEEHRTPSA